MIKKQQNSLFYKKNLILNILNEEKIESFYIFLDGLLLQKHFDNQRKLSLAENVLRIDSIEFRKKDAINILNEFFNDSENFSIFTNRNIYEIVKLSFLPKNKIASFFSNNQLITLTDIFSHLLENSVFLSFDFLILTASQNFLSKVSNPEIAILFQNIIDRIYNKFIIFNYKREKKQKETDFLCWVDKLLKAVINKEISTDDYITVLKKITKITRQTLYTYRKILNSVSYILLQKEFCGKKNLINFKNFLKKEIEKKQHFLYMNKDELLEIFLDTLTKENFTKEDFYYLFDAIEATSRFSYEDKNFCLDICSYLLYYHKKNNIFSYRFIRKYFIDTLLKIFYPSDALALKEKELILLIKIFNIDVFYNFNKRNIVEKFIEILSFINNEKTKLSYNNFYKYCNVLDFILINNKDLIYEDIIDDICIDNDNQKDVIKFFNLSELKAS